MKLLFFALFLVLNADVALAQDAVPSKQVAGSQSADDFQVFLDSLQAVVAQTISSKGSNKLDAQLQAMQVPNFQEWFAATFGQDVGSKMATIYSETLTTEEERLRKSLTTYAELGGQVKTTAVYGGSTSQSTPSGEQADKAIRNVLKHPTTFALVKYTGKSGKTGIPFFISLGYATLVNGSYRLIPENVMRVLPNMPVMRIRQGGAITAASLLNRIPPVYPVEARKQRVSGTVRLHVVIGPSGGVQQIEVISGDRLLVPAAMDAVRQWRYRPTTLNGDRVEVDTTIDVIFSLNP